MVVDAICSRCGEEVEMFFDSVEDAFLCPLCGTPHEINEIIHELPSPVQHKPAQFTSLQDCLAYQPSRAVAKSLHEQYNIIGLYHMTRVENLPSILECGLLSRTRAMACKPRQIADETLVTAAFRKIVPQSGKSIAHYVRFYFNPHNKMLKHDHLVNPEVRMHLIVLEFSPEIIDLPNVVCSTRNAITCQALFYRPEGGFRAIRWDLVYDYHIFRNHEKAELQMAELLVPERVGCEYLRAITCFNFTTLSEVRQTILRKIPSRDFEVEFMSPSQFYP